MEGIVKGKKASKDSPKLAAMRAAREAKYERPTEPAKLPPDKRWPGRFAVRATVYTPEGRRIDIETDLPEATGRMVLDALTRAAAQNAE